MCEFVRSPTPDDIVQQLVIAAAKVAESDAELAETSTLAESKQDVVIGVAARAGARCCYYAAMAVSKSDHDACKYATKAAKAAAMTARQMNDVDVSAAVNDYQTLRSLFTEYAAPHLGDAFDPSATGPLGDCT
jgi:hypothetical protein